jgi:hypothetical protein
MHLIALATSGLPLPTFHPSLRTHLPGYPPFPSGIRDRRRILPHRSSIHGQSIANSPDIVPAGRDTLRRSCRHHHSREPILPSGIRDRHRTLPHRCSLATQSIAHWAGQRSGRLRHVCRSFRHHPPRSTPSSSRPPYAFPDRGNTIAPGSQDPPPTSIDPSPTTADASPNYGLTIAQRRPNNRNLTSALTSPRNPSKSIHPNRPSAPIEITSVYVSRSPAHL